MAALLLAGPLPFRVCACEADHHATGPTTGDTTEPVHHEPDCPLAKPPHPKPAVFSPDSSFDPIDAPAIIEPTAVPLTFKTPIVERSAFVSSDPARPRWLVHLTIQI
ncbi:MAG: hypothetical protein KF873_11905 [Gemmataceae bacterium]|nr:hypothetical protein [Gemmataceae bacterium]